MALALINGRTVQLAIMYLPDHWKQRIPLKEEAVPKKRKDDLQEVCGGCVVVLDAKPVKLCADTHWPCTEYFSSGHCGQRHKRATRFRQPSFCIPFTTRPPVDRSRAGGVTGMRGGADSEAAQGMALVPTSCDRLPIIHHGNFLTPQPPSWICFFLGVHGEL